MKHIRNINEFNSEEIIKENSNSKLVKKDHLGLYVNCNGSIARPFYGTIFKEGDRVKSTDIAYQALGKVTIDDVSYNFKNTELYEYWCTTGVDAYEYRINMSKKNNYGKLPFIDYKRSDPKTYKSFIEYMEEKTEWYKNHNKQFSNIYKKHNINFNEKSENL